MSEIYEKACQPILLTVDQKGTITFASPYDKEFLGYDYTELTGKSFFDFLAPRVAEKFRETASTYMDRKMSLNRLETELLRKDGHPIYVVVSGTPVTLRGAVHYNLMLWDITTEKTAEIELKESEEKFRVLAESSKAAIFMYGEDARFIYFNPQLELLTGYSKEELYNMKTWDLAYPEDKEKLKHIIFARLKREQVPDRYEIRYLTKSGQLRWMENSGGTIYFKGNPAGLVNGLDITDRKQTEKELADAKAQSDLYLDLMAHDIANMNQIGIGFLEMLMDNPSIGPDEKELLQKPLEAFMNTSQLIRNVKKLRAANGGGLKLEKVCVSNVIAQVNKAFVDIPYREVEIRFQYQKDCCVIANGLLTDVFQNIVGNAIKHSPGDKPLTIDIRLDGVERDGVKYCQVAIEDNGPGIPDQGKENIFSRMRREPGKPRGRGMGLVLVHSLIEDFKGRIWVEDRVPGDHTKGARFVIMLPAAGQ